MAQSSIDYQYSPEYWFSALGTVDDFHKPLASEKGALLYDFGPGPYVRPRTRIEIGAQDVVFSVTRQSYGDARIPILDTELTAAGLTAHIQTMSSVPERLAGTADFDKKVVRENGYTGTVGWCNPQGDVDPAFRNVAWGTNRPITYRIAVPEGSNRKVYLGICESYRTRPGLRKLEFHVEGAEPLGVDPLEAAPEPNTALVFPFEANDVDGDGSLLIEVLSPVGDPNTILNAIWVFDPEIETDSSRVRSGELTPLAETYVDGGLEPAVKARDSRQDLLIAQFDGPATPVLTITSARDFTHDPVKGILTNAAGGMQVIMDPPPASFQSTEGGYQAFWARGVRTVTLRVVSGFGEPGDIASKSLDAERARAEQYWLREANIPYGRLLVPDSELQVLLDTSLRTMYQAREVVDNQVQFQPGMALYRGLWVHDGVYFSDTALLLGDKDAALKMLEAIGSHQHSSGQLEVLRPGTMHRETALYVWGITRYAEMTGDDVWLEQQWDRIESAISWLGKLRERTLNIGAVNYGLLPEGFADGGVGGIQAEYASVNWMMIGLERAIYHANRLGKTENARTWTELYESVLTSFKIAARRDEKKDEFGNRFLPARVGAAEVTQPIQQGQWTILEALMHSRYTRPTDPLAKGTMAMLESELVQGLVPGTGWLEEGIWAYFGAFLGEAWLRYGRGDRAHELLYAMANHAAPIGTWVEEQMPVGKGTRTAGDFPHAWGSSMLIRLATKLLVYDQENRTILLRGLPENWLQPDAEISARSIFTVNGPIHINILVSPDGETANVDIIPPPDRASDGSLTVELDTFLRAGFARADGFALPSNMDIPFGQPFSLKLRKSR